MDYCDFIRVYKLVTMHQSVRVCVASPFCVCVHRLFFVASCVYENSNNMSIFFVCEINTYILIFFPLLYYILCCKSL